MERQFLPDSSWLQLFYSETVTRIAEFLLIPEQNAQCQFRDAGAMSLYSNYFRIEHSTKRPFERSRSMKKFLMLLTAVAGISFFALANDAEAGRRYYGGSSR